VACGVGFSFRLSLIIVGLGDLPTTDLRFGGCSSTRWVRVGENMAYIAIINGCDEMYQI
jgi:hypothetical protein